MRTLRVRFSDSFGPSTKSGGIGRDSIELCQALEECIHDQISEGIEFSPTGSIWHRRLGTIFFSIFKVHFPVLVRTGSVVVLPQVSPISYVGKGLTLITRIHDLFPITNPEWFGSNTEKWFGKSLNDDSHPHYYLCNSQYTKNELLRLFKNINPEQCFIGYCQIPLLEGKPCGTCSACTAELPDSYLLAVGTVEPRKNYPRVIQALNELGQKSPSLVIVGRSRELKVSEGTFANQNKLHFVGAVCDGSLNRLYNGARAFISGSLAEGFDIPALEASLRGLPLILSDIPVHREIYGDSASYFNPLEVDEIRNAIEVGLSNPKESDHAQLQTHPMKLAIEEILTKIKNSTI
jgi:glycosyltransferase involved in cell wall biosynthesis